MIMSIPRVKTFVRGLDEKMEGGIPKGSVNLICGTAGTMKSSLAYSILYHNSINAGIPGLYVTLEQDPRSLLIHMEKLDMKERAVDIVSFNDIKEKVKERRVENWIQKLSGFLKEMKDEKKYELLVLDSLNALYSLTTIEDVRAEIYFFFKSLSDLGFTSLLISEMPPEGGRYGEYGVEEFLSDGIIHLLFQRRGGILTSLERYIGIVKMRATNHDTHYFPLLYHEGGFTIYTREDLEL
ncbi:RAD55 family ATPase [Candidatus Pyrohabitans sp.]